MVEAQIYTDEEEAALASQVSQAVGPSYPPLTILFISRDVSVDLLEATLRHTKQTLLTLEIWKMNTIPLPRLCNALRFHPTLQEVLFNLGENASDEEVTDLLDAMTTCCYKLKSLKVYRSSRSRGFAGRFPIQKLCFLPRLETLEMDLQLDTFTARTLFQSLHFNKVLKSLRMSIGMENNLDGDTTPETIEVQTKHSSCQDDSMSLEKALIDMLDNNDVLETLDIQGIPNSTRTTIEFYLMLNILGRKQLRRRSAKKLLDFIIANHNNHKVVFFFLSRHPNIVQNAI